jgi:hypothetical protein
MIGGICAAAVCGLGIIAALIYLIVSPFYNTNHAFLNFFVIAAALQKLSHRRSVRPRYVPPAVYRLTGRPYAAASVGQHGQRQQGSPADDD